jgi:rRNA small subunit pseudouridine methyltransferase Nep1
VPKSGRGHGRRVFVVLEEANLEVIKTNRGFQLLNCDDHLGLHRRLKKDPRDSRPDILHQMLLVLLDSPLNKRGLLQIFVRTKKNVIIEVNPHVRLPRTFKRFAGLMVQLMHKLKIRAADGPKTLLKIVKGPVTRHLPTNCRVYGTSVTGTLVDAHDFVPTLPQHDPLVFVFGAVAHGDAGNPAYAEETVALSEHPLSGAYAVGRLLGGFERHWGIL